MDNTEICRLKYKLYLKESIWDFLPVKGKRPIGLDGNYLKDWTNKKFTIRECFSAYGRTGLGVKTSIRLLCLDFDGESAFDIALEAGIDWQVNEGWEVRRDDEPWRIKQFFTPTPEQIALLPNGEFQGKVKGKDGEALEVFLTNKRQAVILGKHPDGGKYYWPPNNEPPLLKPLIPPNDAIWNFVLKVANEKNSPSTKSSKARCYPTGSTKRLNPCPICGRNRDLWCAESSNGLLWCMNGNTFSAEIAHGPLKIGDVVNGWALVAKGDECITFKVNQPFKPRRPRRPSRPKRPSRKRRVAHV